MVGAIKKWRRGALLAAIGVAIFTVMLVVSMLLFDVGDSSHRVSIFISKWNAN